MTLLGFEGFERAGGTQVVENGVLKTLYTSSGNTNPSYPVGRLGAGRSIQQTGSSGSSTVTTVNTPGIGTEGVMGFAIRSYNVGATASGTGWIKLREGTTNHLWVYLDITTRQWVLRNGANTVTLATSTVGGFDSEAWMYFEIKFKIADSGGYVIIRVNEQEVINVTGVDTRNAGTAGNIDNVTVYGGNSGGFLGLDDMYWLNSTDATATQGAANNDFLGDVVIDELRPAGNGEQNQWVGSDGNSVDNYLLVDETGSPSVADYTGSGTTGQRDNYAMQDLGATYPVFGVNHEVYAWKSDANPLAYDLQATLKQGATEQIDTVCAGTALATTAAWYRKSTGLWRDLNNANWDTTKVNSLISGVKLT